MNLPDLRTRLRVITSTADIDHHPYAIEKLRADFPHTIQLFERNNPTFPRNCFEWALNLDQEVTRWICDFGLPELFAGSRFALELILHMTEISEGDTTDGDLVLYFDKQIPTHAGRLKESQVVSKWGTGHIYKHGFLEAPESYGSKIRFYRILPASVATARFVSYIRHHPDYGAIDEIFEERFGHLYPDGHAREHYY
jgi:hypothetical protein